jgi:hypothetical protein
MEREREREDSLYRWLSVRFGTKDICCFENERPEQDKTRQDKRERERAREGGSSYYRWLSMVKKPKLGSGGRASPLWFAPAPYGFGENNKRERAVSRTGSFGMPTNVKLQSGIKASKRAVSARCLSSYKKQNPVKTKTTRARQTHDGRGFSKNKKKNSSGTCRLFCCRGGEERDGGRLFFVLRDDDARDLFLTRADCRHGGKLVWIVGEEASPRRNVFFHSMRTFGVILLASP